MSGVGLLATLLEDRNYRMSNQQASSIAQLKRSHFVLSAQYLISTFCSKDPFACCCVDTASFSLNVCGELAYGLISTGVK